MSDTKLSPVKMKLSIVAQHEFTEEIKRLSLNVQFVSEERAKELVKSFAKDSLEGTLKDFPQFIEEQLQEKYEDWHICHLYCEKIIMTKLSDNEKDYAVWDE